MLDVLRLLVCGAALLCAPRAIADPPAPEGSTGPHTQPPPPSEPTPGRVDHVGVARWSETLGFVQPSGAPSPAASPSAKSAVIQVPPGAPGSATAATPAADAADSNADPGLDTTVFQLGIGSLQVVPTDNGRNHPFVDIHMLEFLSAIRYARRGPNKLVGFWLDGRLSGGWGTQGSDALIGLPSHIEAQAVMADADVGVDAHPIPQFREVGIGPLVGLDMHFMRAKFVSDGDIPVDDSGESLEVYPNLVFGAHLHFVWGHTEVPRVYADSTFSWHKGKDETGQYLTLEAGGRLGSSVILWGRLDKRVGASGTVSDSDGTTNSNFVAAAMPVAASYMLGIGFEL